jgi:hypothetical protein
MANESGSNAGARRRPAGVLLADDTWTPPVLLVSLVVEGSLLVVAVIAVRALTRTPATSTKVSPGEKLLRA